MVILACSQGFRAGDQNFSPLEDAIEQRLKNFVDPDIWKKAQDYTRFYLRRERKKKAQVLLKRLELPFVPERVVKI